MTGSIVKTLLTPKFAVAKGAKVEALAMEKAAERITGETEPFFQNHHMERGHREEPLARALYEKTMDVTVEECGFITSDDHGIKMGYSPDGLVGDDGFIEIKSRLAKFQVQTISNNAMPSEYMAQIQKGFLVTEREWCDFISYSNGMKMYVERIYPDEAIIDSILKAEKIFDEMVSELVSTYNGADLVVAPYIDQDGNERF
jgi:predicted phage-related endonuclease